MQDIDYLFLFNETTPVNFLKQLKPDVHCNGAEYTKECIEAKIVKKNKGKIKIIPYLKDKSLKFSTTGLIDKIIKRNTNPKTKAIFLDRDGVINVDYGYNHKIEKFKFMEGILPLLKHFKSLGYTFFIMTNQSGIARGIFTEKDMHKFNKHVIKQLKKHNITIKAVYFCPHHPKAKIAKYRRACDCRKPGAVMFQRAKKEYNIDMASSWTIGDKLADCIAGKKAGTSTVLKKSKYVTEKDKKSKYVDFTANHLKDIITFVKK